MALSEDERALLFQRATLAALEALPDLVDKRDILTLSQIQYGLRHARRSLQSDMVFAYLAEHWPRLLRSEKVAVDLSLVLNAYGMYGATGRAISGLFQRLQIMSLDMDPDSPGFLDRANMILTACSRYAIMCKQRAGQPDTFSITVDKRGTYKLGFAMKISGVQSLKIVKIAEGLVKRWNTRHPDWKVSEGDEIIMANAVSSNSRFIADEIQKSDVVTLLLRRGKVSVEVSPQITRGCEPDLDQIIDNNIMRDLASKAVQVMQTEWGLSALTMDNLPVAINIIRSLVILDVDHEQLIDYLGPLITKAIKLIKPSLLITLLWTLSIKNVFNQRDMVRDLIRQGLKLSKRAGSSERKVFISIGYHLQKTLDSGPESSVMREIRMAAEREGITDYDLEHPEDHTRFVLWDTKGSVAFVS